MFKKQTMSNDPKKEYQQIVLPLYLLMQLSIKAYKKYMQNKIYLHALVIMSSNIKVYNFIINHIGEIPEPIQDDALELVNHYDIWMTQFNAFEADKKPSLNDDFIFHHLDQQSAFPRQAEQNIFTYYHQLKSSIKPFTNE